MGDDIFFRDLARSFEWSDPLRRRVLNSKSDLLKELTEPFIDGVEVTQAIQYYKSDRHLTDPNDQAPDNSMRLVALKPAWVRVYVRTGPFGNDQVVTGSLEILRNTGRFDDVYTSITTLTPNSPTSVTTDKNLDYATQRSQTNKTLNFQIPEDEMLGRLRLIVRIWIVGTVRQIADKHELDLDVTLRQTLRLRGILISYDGPDPSVNSVNPPVVSLPAPTLNDLRDTAVWATRTYPVEAQPIFSVGGTLAWSTPMSGTAASAGSCNNAWFSLNSAIAAVAANDGNRDDVVYFGLLPASTPFAFGSGCASLGQATCCNKDIITFAHEVGHVAGLGHGPCGTPGDPNYPIYEPYDPPNNPTASIGEYGLDINNGAIQQPTKKDYMSYCLTSTWISLFHYARLLNNGRFHPQIAGNANWKEPLLVDPFLWYWEYQSASTTSQNPGNPRTRASKVISIIGVVDSDRRVNVHSLMRLTALPIVRDGRESSLVAQLLGPDNSVMASAPVMRFEAQGCGCQDNDDGVPPERRPFTFQALIPDTGPGETLRIIRLAREVEDDKEVWSRHAPAQQPQIASFDVRAREGYLHAKWRASGAGEQPLEFALQYSKDQGRSWNGLVIGLRGNGYTFSATNLPSGSVVFRLLAHDGFFSSTTESRPVKLPRQPPSVRILHPSADEPLIAGQTMRLWAVVRTETGELVERKACRWVVDGEEIGIGTEAWMTAPPEGKHSCVVYVQVNKLQSEASIEFTTVDRAQTFSPGAAAPGKPRRKQKPTTKIVKKARK